MSVNTKLSPPANGGNGIEQAEAEMRDLIMDCFEVQETLLPVTSIKMDMKGLEAFCRKKGDLPLFHMVVNSRSTGVISIEDKNPQQKFFTLWNNCCIYATVPIAQKNNALVMEGGELLVA